MTRIATLFSLLMLAACLNFQFNNSQELLVFDSANLETGPIDRISTRPGSPPFVQYFIPGGPSTDGLYSGTSNPDFPQILAGVGLFQPTLAQEDNTSEMIFFPAAHSEFGPDYLFTWRARQTTRGNDNSASCIVSVHFDEAVEDGLIDVEFFRNVGTDVVNVFLTTREFGPTGPRILLNREPIGRVRNDLSHGGTIDVNLVDRSFTVTGGNNGDFQSVARTLPRLGSDLEGNPPRLKVACATLGATRTQYTIETMRILRRF